jgi:predicted RNA-binding Zn-ribbon protein involved in translation (DUF1610 family)
MVASDGSVEMAEIRVLCPQCGMVDIAARSIRLVVSDREHDSGIAVFECPECNVVHRSNVDERTGRALARAGVVRSFVSSPVRPAHPEHPAPGPVLTFDDLLDLHELLEQDNWFEELARSVREEEHAWDTSS